MADDLLSYRDKGTVSELEDFRNMAPLDAMKLRTEIENKRLYSPAESDAIKQQNLSDLAYSTPILGNFLSARDVPNYLSQVYDNVKHNDMMAARKAMAMAGMSALGTIPGLPFGKTASQVARNADTTLPAIIAYHGSPHDFDKFRWDKTTRGTGEGAQAYGDGLYFAENPAVAGQYAKDLGGHSLNGKPIDSNSVLANVLERQSHGELTPEFEAEVARLLHEAKTSKYQNQSEIKYFEDYQAAIEQAKQGVAGRPGKLYKTELDVDHHQLLDWDKPLSEQSPEVRRIVNDHFADVIDAETKAITKYDESWTPDFGSASHSPGSRAELRGSDLADLIGKYRDVTKAEATQALREAGIPGIRFLDQGSRGAEGGTHNIVMFDDSLIKIISKDGLEGKYTGSERP